MVSCAERARVFYVLLKINGGTTWALVVIVIFSVALNLILFPERKLLKKFDKYKLVVSNYP
jgi:hypothetical protein